MTCASCASRIERKLNKLDGVTASVNYATEKATVEFDPARVSPDALVDAVEQVGYSTHLPQAEPAAVEDDPTAGLRRRLIVSAVLSLPVLLMGMIPALQFTYWQWLALELATPVVLWAGVAVPRRRVEEPPPRGRDDGHPDLARHARGLGLVGRRPLLPRRRRHRDEDAVPPDAVAVRVDRPDLSRGRVRRGDVPARRAVLRGSRQAPRREQRCARSSSSGRRRPRSSSRTGPSGACRSSSSR